MHEVITLSFSQRANNVATHFYNVQESRLYAEVNNSIHLMSRLSPDGRTANYYPRALLWDYSNGFGSLGKYEYFEHTDIDSLKKQFDNIIVTGEKVPKSDYQKQLDAGGSTNGPDSVKYWSDFSRVIYRPESLNSLQGWDYDFEAQRGHLKMHPEIYFEGCQLGANEFDNAMFDNFRKILEDCDTINGLNVITEQDTAWGGFSAQALALIRDDYLPKSPVLVWALCCSQKLQRRQTMERIRTTTSLLEQCLLYLPLEIPDQSNWLASSYQMLPLDFVSSLTMEKSRVGLNQFIGVLAGTSGRKMVSEINVNGIMLSPRGHIRHTFARSVISRDEPDTKLCDFQNLAQTGTDARNLHAFHTTVPFDQKLDSFPEEFKQHDPFNWCKFDITDQSKDTIDEMLKFVVRFSKGDEREELREQLSDLKEVYTWWNEDSDEYDI